MKYEYIMSFDLKDSQDLINLLDDEGTDAFLAELRLYYLPGHHHIVTDVELADEMSGTVIIEDQYVAWYDRDRLEVGIACALIH